MDFNQQLIDFFEVSPDLMCFATLEGYFSKINPAFSKTLGYSEDELLAKKFIEFVHPEDIAPTLAELEKLSKGQRTFNFKNRYKHISGHYITLSWASYCNVEDDIIYATARDVTLEQRKSEELKQIQLALNDKTIVAVTDPKGRITRVNHNFCTISGYSESELIGRTHKVVNSGTHPKSFFQNMWKTISAGNVWSGVIQNRKKNGDHYFVSTIITPIFDDLGNITEYLSFRYDVTQSVEYQAKALSTAKILNETGAIAKVGGWELEIATGELTWTDETFRILEVEKKQTQKPVLPEGISLFIPEHQPIIETAVNNAIERGEPYSLELVALTAKGNKKWVYTNGRANYKNGEIVTLSGTIQDIDEKKKAQISLEKEKAKSLHHARLASLGELSASVAHEINNPLTIISTYCEVLLVKGQNHPKFAEITQRIQTSAERISKIVRSLKKFSRSDGDTHKHLFNVHSMVEEIRILMTPKLKRENVILNVTCPTNIEIFGNENEVEQVLINLMNNSIDAIAQHDEKWIELVVDEDSNRVNLNVTDSGNGIPLGVRDKIFDPFFTTKPSDKGTGLGLSIVLGILEEHNANIELDLQCDNTKFVIVFTKQSWEKNAN